MSVNITVLFFAKAREIANRPKTTLTTPSRIPCNELLLQIIDQFHLQSIANHIILAHNQEFCDLNSVLELNEGDEIAVVPPLSGG